MLVYNHRIMKKIFKNRKHIILFLAVAAFIIGAIIAFIVTSNNFNNQTSSQDTSAAPSDKEFAPAQTATDSFIVNISIDGASSDATATLSYDGKGNNRYDFTKDGKKITIYYVGSNYYICSGEEKCISYPISQIENSGFNPNLYQYDTQRVNELKGLASYQGHAPCPAGTCDVWVFDSQDGSTKICTDINNAKLSFIEVTKADKVTKATYTYQPVKIYPPSDSVSL